MIAITIAVIVIVIATISMNLLTHDVNTIVILDLSLGVLAFILAMYIFNKEQKLEEKISRITTGKTRNAYVDILTNLIIFGRTLDNTFINSHKEGDTVVDIGNSTNIQLLHRNMSMVFTAHIDVIDKNIMGRLAQHISFLERYVNETSVEMRRHMDNMHDMDTLINMLSKHVDDNHISKKWIEDNHLKSRRQNHFMMYLLEKIRGFVTQDTTVNSEQEIRSMVRTYQNYMVYYIDEDSNVFNKVMTEISKINSLVASKPGQSLAESQEYILAINSIIKWVRDLDEKMIGDQIVWVEQLADYSVVMGPMTFLIRILKKLDDDPSLTYTVNFHISSILDIVKQECTHIPQENKEYVKTSLEDLIDFDGTKDECMKKISELNDYLVEQHVTIQKEHI